MIIIGAIIYQGMILGACDETGGCPYGGIHMDGLQRCEGGAEGKHPQRMRAVDRVISLIDHPEERKETVTERFLEVAPPAPRGATAVLEGPVPSVSGK